MPKTYDIDPPMFSLAQKITFGIVILAGIAVFALFSEMFEVNQAGYILVKQSPVAGEMDVIMTPGMFPRMFSAIHEYKISDVYDFNSPSDTIGVRFKDAATAQISGQIKYRLPLKKDQILQIHQDFRSYAAVQSDLIRQVVAAALKQSATLFGAEEVYSTRRSDFIALVNDQIRDGLYATTYTETYVKDEDGNQSLKRNIMVKTDAEGRAVLSENSAFKRYNIEVIQLVINDVVFDDKTNELIAERKKADQQKVVARANAERAKQDAITAEAEGRANVAKAEADADVEKKKATVAAEQETEVAHQRELQAEQNKLATIANGQADAEAAALKVKAGLSPLERATIDKETAIGVAHELAQVRLPQLMVLGGGGSAGGQVNPFDAVGLQSLINISHNLTNNEKEATLNGENLNTHEQHYDDNKTTR